MAGKIQFPRQNTGIPLSAASGSGYYGRCGKAVPAVAFCNRSVFWEFKYSASGLLFRKIEFNFIKSI
ncbi:MAG TPA: hypothetical protein DCX97_10475 [Alistipes sp.]|nr:hypothetical protein [Alistipes sp.]